MHFNGKLALMTCFHMASYCQLAAYIQSCRARCKQASSPYMSEAILRHAPVQAPAMLASTAVNAAEKILLKRAFAHAESLRANKLLEGSANWALAQRSTATDWSSQCVHEAVVHLKEAAEEDAGLAAGATAAKLIAQASLKLAMLSNQLLQVSLPHTPAAVLFDGPCAG